MTRSSSFRGRPVRQTERGGRKVPYVAGQLVVKLKPQFSSDLEARERVLSVLPKDCTIESGFDEMGMALINLPDTIDLFEAARALKSQAAVEFAEPNFIDSGS